MAKIALIQPWNFHDEDRAYTAEQLSRIWRNAPLGLCLLGAEAGKRGHEVEVMDLERELIRHQGNVDATLRAFRERLVRFEPEVVGVGIISVRFQEALRVLEVCGEVRRASGRRFTLVAGNIHVTSEPELTLRSFPELDAVFVGEADFGLSLLAEGTPLEKIPGVGFLRDGKFRRTPPPPDARLDDLPYPDWRLIDAGFYSAPNSAIHRAKRAYRSLDIVTCRSCVYECRYCVYNMGTPRWNSPAYVVDYLEWLVKEFGVDATYFLDSSLGNNRPQLKGICNLMIERGLHEKLAWSANMRANQVNEDLLRLMWDAGCRMLLYGFESGSQRILDAMKKGCSVEANEKAAKLHEKLNFPYQASMIYGYPGETEEDVRLTIGMLQRMQAPVVGINVYVPLPGSQDYVEMRAAGSLPRQDPRYWRMIGEVSESRDVPVYAAIPKERFWDLYQEVVNWRRGIPVAVA